jgi:hypothetical protein
LTEDGFIAGEDDIASHRKLAASSKSEAVHCSNDGLGGFVDAFFPVREKFALVTGDKRRYSALGNEVEKLLKNK